METMRMWIGGEWTAAASGRTIYAVNPATEQRIACLPHAGESDAARAAEAARQAFAGWSKRPVAERSRMVARIAREIREHAADLAMRETAHRGTPVRHTIPGYLACAEAFETASRVGTVLMNNLIDSGPSVPYYLKARPVGVCSFVLPWHAPFRSISRRLACALVAGNTCIIECPAYDSLAALRLAEIVDTLDLPPGILNVLTGTADAAGEPCCLEQTGERAPAPAMTRGAGAKSIPFAQNLTHPIPFLVLEDADVDMATEKALLTAFGNCGLPWASPGRYYIHERLYDRFSEKFIKAAERLVVGDPADPATDIGPALSSAHRDAVLRHIAETTRQGATLLSGGRPRADRLPERGYFLLPAILGDIDVYTEVDGQEVFGSIACLSPFSSVGQILDLADSRVLGRALQICTKNPAEEARIETALSAGSFWWDDEAEDGAEVGGDYPGCAFAHATGDFAFSIRFGTIYKDYTTDFVGHHPPNQN